MALKLEQINWDNKVREMIPWVYRTADFVDWMRSILVKPITTVSTVWFRFFSFYDNILVHSAETIYLEKYLNDLFDNDNRGIYIDNIFLDQVYLFRVDEVDQETYIFNVSEDEDEVYLFNDGEALGDSNFIVYVPTAALDVSVATNMNRIKAEVNRFVFAGLTFTVTNY